MKGSFGFPNRQDTLNPWGHWLQNGTLIPLAPDHHTHYLILCYAGDSVQGIVDYSKWIQLHLPELKYIITF
ncbi:MAG: hypothetical protein R2852_02010 [Bacteroidia bacterium]